MCVSFPLVKMRLKCTVIIVKTSTTAKHTRNCTNINALISFTQTWTSKSFMRELQIGSTFLRKNIPLSKRHLRDFYQLIIYGLISYMMEEREKLKSGLNTKALLELLCKQKTKRKLLLPEVSFSISKALNHLSELLPDMVLTDKI